MLNFIQQFRRIQNKLHLDSSLPFITLVSYTIVGAALFRALEFERDRIEREHFKRAFKFALNHTALNILAINSSTNFDPGDRKLIEKAVNEIYWLLSYLNLTQVVNEKIEQSPWSWYGSMFYAGQLYTTIGYGLPVAKTRAGQILSIFYILAGIPIFLIILKNVGKMFSKFFRKLYKRIKSARNKLPPKMYLGNLTVPLKGIYTSSCSIFLTNFNMQKKIPKDVEKLENGQITKLNDSLGNRSVGDAFPIAIAFAILIIWIFFSAAMFCLWETQWGFLTSVYFFCVSISTVGLGDVVPSNKNMMLANFILILFGLALLSMCFDVIQITVERMLDEFLQQCFEEIERVAAMLNKQGELKDCIPPPRFEKKSWRITDRIRDWIASQVVCRLISSKLEMHNYDSDSDDEFDSSFDAQGLRDEVKLMRQGHWMALRIKRNPSFLKALEMLKKCKGFQDNNRFKSVLFFKFITNEKLDQILTTYPCIDTDSKADDPENNNDKNSEVSLDCLDDDIKVKKCSLSTFDMESLESKAYNDIQFGDSYASFWTTPENNSEFFVHSEASLDLTCDENIERLDKKLISYNFE